MNRPASIFIALTLSLAASLANAHSSTPVADASGPQAWRITFSTLTYHYHYDDEHRHVYSLGLERQTDSALLYGASWFRNSFGQHSAYLYAGGRRDDLGGTPAFVQVTGGLLYGYRGQYKDKVPLNCNGFSPGLVVSLGWKLMHGASAQLNFLGNSAVMLQFSIDAPK